MASPIPTYQDEINAALWKRRKGYALYDREVDLLADYDQESIRLAVTEDLRTARTLATTLFESSDPVLIATLAISMGNERRSR